jgi:hypothetical protein
MLRHSRHILLPNHFVSIISQDPIANRNQGGGAISAAANGISNFTDLVFSNNTAVRRGLVG